jgi:hypothetical protein
LTINNSILHAVGACFIKPGTGAQAVYLSGLMNQTPTKRPQDAKGFFLNQTGGSEVLSVHFFQVA